MLSTNLCTSPLAPSEHPPAQPLTLLQQWVRFARRHVHQAPSNPALSYYGTGASAWAAQTNQKATLAFAVVATDTQYDSALTGTSRDALLQQSLAMLRYTLATHQTGPIPCTDLARWGQSWISVLGLERSFPALRLLSPYMDAADHQRLREVLLAEAQWLLEHFPVVAGLVENNRPEANLWNAAFLWKVHHLYPGTLDTDRLTAKVAALIRNGFSTPASLAALAPAIRALDGADIGPNFSDSFALHHHRYLNIGYLAICLSQIALLHHECASLNIPEPPQWLDNVQPAWELLRSLTFPDGRLIRIGGDTRVRYCYCQDYNIPIWHLASRCWGDTAAPHFYKNWLQTVALEARLNGDGSFLSDRCGELAERSPIYYHRLESDRSVSLALSRYWERETLSPLADSLTSPASALLPPSQWADPFHGAYQIRTKDAFYSWVWRAAEPPQGLCLPLSQSHLAEWRTNLAGSIHGMGRRNFQAIDSFHGTDWEGGFATGGTTTHISDGWLAEGQQPAHLARQQTACIVWQGAMYLFQRCTALQRTSVNAIKGLHLNIPNDLFNHFTRHYRCEKGSFQSHFADRTCPDVPLDGRTVTIDGHLHVRIIHSKDTFTLHRPPSRNIDLKLYAERDFGHNPGTLLSEELCLPLRLGPHPIEPGQPLYDFACQLLPHPSPAEPSGALPEAISLHDTLRGIRLRAGDGKVTLLLFNAGDTPTHLPLPRGMAVHTLSQATLQPAGELHFAAEGIAILTSSANL